MPEPVPCQEGRPCRNRARFLVECVGWTLPMCGVHAKPYQRDLERNGSGYPYAYLSGVKSVKPLDA